MSNDNNDISKKVENPVGFGWSAAVDNTFWSETCVKSVPGQPSPFARSLEEKQATSPSGPQLG